MVKQLMYPVIITEFNDEDGHYFVATSPNIPGMVTQGTTFAEAAYWSKDVIVTMLDGEKIYPKPQDPDNWTLNKNDRVINVTVTMTSAAQFD